jgi:hypothetical protein
VHKRILQFAYGEHVLPVHVAQSLSCPLWVRPCTRISDASKVMCTLTLLLKMVGDPVC